MSEYSLDIILPVWNKPVETRAALASFVAESPDARIIMVNNGSERETEIILDEFAEALDDRALLVASSRNIGSVAALNMGLARATSSLILLATSYTRFSTDWFQATNKFFQERADAGGLLLTPGASLSAPVEADHGSFDSFIIRKELYDCIGGFDSAFDGSIWSLRDYTRRATAAGFKTYSMTLPQLTLLPYAELGSVARRDERLKVAEELFCSRWGGHSNYLVVCRGDLLQFDCDCFIAALLVAGRSGNTVTVIVDQKGGKELGKWGGSSLHENINLQVLPRFFADSVLKKIIVKQSPQVIVVSCEAPLNADQQSISLDDFISKFGGSK